MTKWEIKPLVDVATLQRGFDLPIQDRIPGKYPIFAANGSVGTHNYAKVKAPGVLTGRSGTLGKVHYVEEDYWPLNTSLWVKDFHGNDPKWIFWLLSWMRLEQYTRGTGVPTLNRNLIHNVNIAVPPIAQQKRIAAILDKADAVRRKRRDAIRLTEELLRSTFLEMFGDPVTNPKSWDVVNLQKTFQHKPQIGTTTPASEDGIYRVVRVGELGGSNVRIEKCAKINVSEADFLKFQCVPGDFLLARAIGSESHLGKSSIMQENANNVIFDSHVMRLRFSPQKVLPEFFEIWLKTKGGRSLFMKEAGRTAVQFNVNATQISRIKIPLPPIEKQRVFLSFYQQNTLSLKKQNSSLEKSENLFSSLLQRAFTGDL